jgi:hypothetical protein
MLLFSSFVTPYPFVIGEDVDVAGVIWREAFLVTSSVVVAVI